MKLSPKSQLGLCLSPSISDMLTKTFDTHYETCIDTCPDEELRNTAIVRWVDLFNEELPSNTNAIKKIKEINCEGRLRRLKNKNYLITDSAMQMLSRIKIDKDKFDIRFLSKIKDKKITFLLGRDLFIRYEKRDDVIFAVRLSVSPLDANGQIYSSYNAFMIDIDDGCIQLVNSESPLSDPNFILFLQLLIFTELSELEIVELKPKEKTPSTRKEGKYVNESNNNIVIVSSAWNRISIRTDGFSVCGHFRLQPCGKDFIDRRLIYIEEFEKEGYVRNAKKETVL